MRLIVFGVFSVFLSGCGGTLECNSSAAKETIVNMVSSNMLSSKVVAETWGKEFFSHISDVMVSNVKTLDHNENADSYACSATYSLIYNGRKFEHNINYDLSYIEDKKETEVSIQNFVNLSNKLWFFKAEPTEIESDLGKPTHL